MRKLLHAISHAFQLRQRFLDVALVARAFAGLTLLPQRGLGLLHLIAQMIQAHGHGGFPHPRVHSLALPDPFRALAHFLLKLGLLRFRERFAKLGRNRILRSGHAARGVGHLLLQLLELVRHLFFLTGHLRVLLLRLTRLRAA